MRYIKHTQVKNDIFYMYLHVLGIPSCVDLARLWKTSRLRRTEFTRLFLRELATT